MKKLGLGLALVAFVQCAAGVGYGQELKSSPRPSANPLYRSVAPQASVLAASDNAQMTRSLRPVARPDGLVKPSGSGKQSQNAGGIEFASAPRPPERPRAAEQSRKEGNGKKPAVAAPKETGSAKGSVCGVAAIKGTKIAPIGSKVNGCGLEDGVRVTSVSGVRLSQAATIDCTTAKALNTWVERAVQPAYGHQVVELKIAGHYVCRSRNHKKGAKISEHGRGRAVDISGFVLKSGKTHMVLRGFDKTMRQAHKGACGIFGTTLGPGSDGYHEDHLHLDTARHSNGAYCR